MDEQEFQILNALMRCPHFLDLRNDPPWLIYLVLILMDDGVVEWVGEDQIAITECGKTILQDFLTECREIPYTKTN